MVTGIIARKLGMTQVFAPDGTVTPATLVKAGPCVVLQAKAAQSDGYEAVQLGFVEEKPAKVNKALGGHYKKAGNVPPTRVRREVKVATGPGDNVALKAGDQVLVGGAATHGSMFHRAPGSIGASSFPSRVVKGMRAAGRMGGDRVTTRNLKIVQVDAENNLLLIRGAVPGAPGTYIMVRKAVAAKKEPQVQAEKAGKVTVAKKPAAKGKK